VKKLYGSLVGVRPGKLADHMLALGFAPREVVHRLCLERDVDPLRANLLVEVALLQRELLAPFAATQHLVSLYIGIPFCPSRCAYCSFASHSLDKYRRAELERYCEGLVHEISSLGTQLRQLGLKVATCYIGGGTPTTLARRELSSLLAAVRALPLWESAFELTVEAGRADTMEAEKLDILPRDIRLAINPQSMHDATLTAIGRSHTVEQVREKYALARAMGFDNINMDLIVGLPGEDAQAVGYSMAEVLDLAPDSVTLHMFSRKRASRFGGGEVWQTMDDTEAYMASDLTTEMLRQRGLRPYYLYRQRAILAGLENIGWARPGKECLYNMLIIGESQTIIGVGAGATSIFPLKTTEWERHANPKDAKMYLDRLPQLVAEKGRLLSEWRSKL